VVKNGIDTELFSGGRAVLKELPQLRGKKVIGFVGRLAKEKGLAYLVKAVRPIMKEDGNVALVLVGDGPYHDELCGLIKELDLEEHIVILGKRSDLADLYASMDVCVLPSLNEGVPMAVLEAMAAGKPVLATRVGGIPEIIQDGQTGLLIEPADQSQLTLALKRLLVSPELCEELGQRGRDRVCSHFSARGMAQAYLAMYAEAGAESDGIAKAADASPSPNTARPFVIKGGDPKISIIIPALNEENVIGRCLDALEKNDAPRSAFEVIVVDNGSTDRTPDVAMSFENVLTIKVLKVAKVHISAARNRGAAEARGKFLAFLDADCLAPPNWLSSALRLLQESEASIIGAHYGIPDDSTWVGRLWTQDRFASRTGEVSYLPAGDLLVNRETFSSIGGFDESIQTNEDFDLCERARAVGLSVRSHPELKVIHLGTPRTLSAFYRKQRWHGMHVFTVFLRDPDKRKNRRPVLLAIYTVACLAGIMAGVLAALAGASWNISMLSALLLTAPLVGVALTKSVRRRKWSEVIPLALLYLTFSIARARSLLNYKTWKPSHRSSRAGVPV